jgi:hypothetical protein
LEVGHREFSPCGPPPSLEDDFRLEALDENSTPKALPTEWTLHKNPPSILEHRHIIASLKTIGFMATAQVTMRHFLRRIVQSMDFDLLTRAAP